ARLEADVRQLAAIGRPGWRNHRFARAQRHLGVLAIGVGHLQFVGIAALEHVGDAGREYAAHAGDLFVDAVGDLVGHAAQFLFGTGERHAVELAFLDRVGQAVAHVVAAIGATSNAAVGQEVGALGAPVIVGHRRIDVQAGTGGADQAELASAGQVGADDFGNGAAMHVVHGKIGDRHRILGGAGAR